MVQVCIHHRCLSTHAVAGATSRPLIFRPLPAPHRTCTKAPCPRHWSPTSQSVMSVSCDVLSVSRQRHVSAMPHALQALPLRFSKGSLCFQPLPRPSSAFSLCLCLCIAWTNLRPFSCINSGPSTLPVPHLSLFWLWAQVSLHLYIVRDLLTSGSGHRSASA
jgi:hypothetical protein